MPLKNSTFGEWEVIQSDPYVRLQHQETGEQVTLHEDGEAEMRAVTTESVNTENARINDEDGEPRVVEPSIEPTRPEADVPRTSVGHLTNLQSSGLMRGEMWTCTPQPITNSDVSISGDQSPVTVKEIILPPMPSPAGLLAHIWVRPILQNGDGTTGRIANFKVRVKTELGSSGQVTFAETVRVAGGNADPQFWRISQPMDKIESSTGISKDLSGPVIEFQLLDFSGDASKTTTLLKQSSWGLAYEVI